MLTPLPYPTFTTRTKTHTFMIYISKRKNRNTEVSEAKTEAFLQQFSEPRRNMMLGHIAFTSDLMHFLAVESSRKDLPLRQVDVTLRASSLVAYLTEDMLDNLTEIYIAEGEYSSPPLSDEDLFITGYRNSLDYFKETVNNIIKKGTFKDGDLNIAKSFYTATGLELANRLGRLMESDDVFAEVLSGKEKEPLSLSKARSDLS